MSSYLEVWRAEGPQLLPLEGDKIVIGRDPEADVTLDDQEVSRLHAVVEHLASGWILRDLGSRNGTRLNSEPLLAEHALKPNDEVFIGASRLVYRVKERPDSPTTTTVGAPPPELTRREREVLVSLSRPVLAGNLMSEPSTLKDIAAELVITYSAVKKHIGRLYDKFEIPIGERRRGRLVSEALQRGAIGTADLRAKERP